MNESELSDFELIRSFPRPRVALPRMADLKNQMQDLSNSDEEDSLDEDDSESFEQDFYDEVDKSYERNHIPPQEKFIYAQDLTEKYNPRKYKTITVECTERHAFSWVVAFLISVLIALFLFFMTNNSTAHSSKSETNLYPSKVNLIKNLEQNIDSISQTFKKQSPEIWVDFIAGIAEVVNYQNRPAIFFLFANQDDTMLCLAKMIANATKAALGSDNNLWLSASDMGSDYGTVIDKFKEKIEEQKVVIVDNLLNIDSQAMLAFHHLCDKENPLVKKAVYIITMVADGYLKEQKPIEFVEDQLVDKMKNIINRDKLQPLITRITDGPIIPIQPEPDIRSCPLRY